MSRMLKALERMEEKTVQRPDSLTPLTAAELAELNAKSCQTTSQPSATPSAGASAESALDQAEQFLQEASAKTIPLGDLQQLLGQPTVPLDLTNPMNLTDVQPSESHLDSTSRSSQANLDAVSDWIVTAATEAPPAEHVMMADSGLQRFASERVTVHSAQSAPPVEDAAASVQLGVYGDSSWRVASCIEPPPAESTCLVEPPDWAPPPSGPEAPQRQATGDDVAWSIESFKPPDSRVHPTTLRSPEAPPSVASLDRRPKTAHSPSVATQTRRQCEHLAEQLRHQWADVPSVLLLFARVDDDAPAGPVVATLATLLAEENAGRVLLTDAWFNEPAAGGLFAYDRPLGLADYLSRGAPWDQLPTTSAGLWLDLLPGGHWHSGSAAAQADDEWTPRCAEIKSRYRYVLVDATGLSRAESRGLISASDGVYLLAELGRSTEAATEAAADTVRAAGGVVSGCVLIFTPDSA